MSAIAGVFYPDTLQMNNLIDPMLTMLNHRCDGTSDRFTHKNVEVGVCGQKLAFNEKKTIIAGLDGSFDNAEELFQTLKQHGFRSDSDNHTALLIQAYILWGSAAVSHLDGDFAFFILDTQEKKILLARDRIGKKPLYWYHDHNQFIFGTELKAILATGAIPRTPALDAFASYLYFGYIPQDMTPIHSVNKLLPAYYLEFKFDQNKSIKPYWSYSSFFEKRLPVKKIDVMEHLNTLLEKSVKRNVGLENSVGCFISGGLGSASIAHYLNGITDHKVTGFTVGFKDQNNEDVIAANLVTKTLAIPHEVENLTESNLLDNLVDIVWHLDEPLADPNITATWKLAEMAAKKTSIVFSGMGSDELLAGHSRYTIQEEPQTRLNILKQRLMPVISQVLIPMLKTVYKPGAFALLKRIRTNPWQFDYLRHGAIFCEKTLSEAAPFLSRLFDPMVFLHKFNHLTRIKSNVGSYMYFDVKTRLPDNYMLQYGNLTAAHQLHWKTPYLDRQIIEYLASLAGPNALQEKETALFLKGILRNIYPECIVNRSKTTRKDFLNSWSDQPQLQEVFKLLPRGQLVETGIISGRWLTKQVNHIGKTPESFRHLWSILVLEIWYRLFISRPISLESSQKINVVALLRE